MTTVNKGEFFVVRFVDQFEREPEGGWVLVLEVNNLAVEPSYFEQCVKSCYAEDVTSTVTDNRIVFNFVEKVQEAELEAFCEGVATEILNELSKSPNWGEKDGPDLKDDYDLLD